MKYLKEDYEYLKKYFSADFLDNVKSRKELLIELDDKIVEVGFDDKMEFYNAEGHKLQEIYDNIYDMN